MAKWTAKRSLDYFESSDFVMFGWRKAAELVRDGKAERFGFITTNSIHQTFNRCVIGPFVAAASNRQAQLHLAKAIPDHPWIDSADGAAVRIAMTVAALGHAEGILEKVVAEQFHEDGENEVAPIRRGATVAPNLQIGADTTTVNALESHRRLSTVGVKLHGKGFLLNLKMAAELRPQEANSPLLIFRNSRFAGQLRLRSLFLFK